MLIKALQLMVSVLLVSAAMAGQAQLAQTPAKSNPDSLLIRAVDFKLIAGDLKYEGAEADSGDVCLHGADPLTLGGINYYWSDADKHGLFAEGKSASKIYQPYELAVREGWYKKAEDDKSCDNLWGMFVSGGHLWMGSDGLGLLEFDPQRESWSRFDWGKEARPRDVTYLRFVDERYLFFSSTGRVGTRSFAPFVYSRQHHLCAQLSRRIDSRIANQDGSPIESLQFNSPEAKQSYYLVLDNEFAGLAANRH
jgi:hypothetical protein